MEAGRQKNFWLANGQNFDDRMTKSIKQSHHYHADRQTKLDAAGQTMGKFINVQFSETVTDVGTKAAGDQRGKIKKARAETSKWQNGRRMSKSERHMEFLKETVVKQMRELD
jgi:hypothetical protein